MGRSVFSLALLLAGHATFAQVTAPPAFVLPINPEPHRITYLGSIAVPTVSQHDLYIRSKIWFTTAFYASQRVLLADDKEAGILAGREGFTTNITYGLLIPLPNRVAIHYTIRLAAQPSGYAYYLTDFQFEGRQPNPVGDLLDPTPGLVSLLQNPAVEPVYLARHPDGTPTKRATRFSLVLDQQMQLLVTSLRAAIMCLKTKCFLT